MDNKEKKDLIENFKNAEKFIIITEERCALCGDAPTLLTMYVHITEQLMGCKFIDKEILEHAFNLGTAKDEKERERIMGESIKDTLKEQLKKLEDALEEVL